MVTAQNTPPFWPRFWIVAAAMALVAGLVWSGASRPSVLVVHSQNERIPWIRGIDAGIDRVIDQSSAIRLQRIYLYGHSEERVSTQIVQAHGLIARWRPDVLLLVDDLAQARVGAAYVAGDRPQIVYSGIEDAQRTLARTPGTHIRGIAERTPWGIVERSLLRLTELSDAQMQEPAYRRRIALISDAGPAADEEARGFASHRWQGAQPVGVWRCATLDQWQQALGEIAQQADMVVIGDYRNLPGPGNLSASVWRRLLAQAALERLKIPMTALSAYAVSDGIPMGILPSPFEQGEVAAQMAVQVSRSSGSEFSAERGQHALTQDFALVVNRRQMELRRLSIGAMDAYYARVSGRLLGGGVQ